jgi:arabinofuranosyltransferase
MKPLLNSCNRGDVAERPAENIRRHNVGSFGIALDESNASKQILFEAVIVAVALTVFVISTREYFRSAFIDDSYIFSRYARNLASGRGLVWTPGEHPVEGFTSLLWVLLLGCGSRALRCSVVTVALWLGIGLGATGLAMSWLAARLALPRNNRFFSVIAPVILTLNPLYVRHAVSGMETILVMSVVLVACVLWAWRGITIERRLPWLAGVTFLAFLSRPDALLLGVVGTILVCLVQSNGRRTLRHLALRFMTPIGLAILVYSVAKLLYFGSVVPLPAYMKVRPLAIYTNVASVHFVLGEELAFIAATAPLLLITIAPILLKPCATDTLVWAIVGVTIVFMSYLLLVLPVMSLESRFYCPLLGLLAVSCSIGVARFVTFEEFAPTRLHGRCAALILVSIVAASELGTWNVVKRSVASARPLCNEAIGRAFESFEGISIAGSESGAIPYFSNGRFLDLGGLNDAFIARNRFKPDIVWRFRDYLEGTYGLPDVYLDPFPEYYYASMANQPEIAASYEAPVKVASYAIYVRKDALGRTALVRRLKEMAFGSCR